MQLVELDALEALLAKASPGEWTASSHDWFALRTHALIICDRPPVFYAESHTAWPDNSTAVAALHNAAADLIAELRELRELREANRWRPIAEATKDNTGIEAIDSRTGLVRVVDYYKGGYPANGIHCWALQGASNECYPLDYFTHFRPIPNSPESK